MSAADQFVARPVRTVATGDSGYTVEVCAHEYADGYGVYEVRANGEEWWLCDTGTKEDAERIIKALVARQQEVQP